ncbi:unnamed protein product [Linum tenue]|uniref:Uncharacterized protein n=1 Tax=Linum tenue TaxID=586396 RepID=A0AAV0KUC7_9ROSI|nr:unnamed protein product [Linum tenue]
MKCHTQSLSRTIIKHINSQAHNLQHIHNHQHKPGPYRLGQINNIILQSRVHHIAQKSIHP